jgi:phage shock protein A
MSEYVDVDIIENGKVIGTFKCRHVTEEKATIDQKADEYAYNEWRDFPEEQAIARKGFKAGVEFLQADYDKQKEINKELVDDMAELHKRIRELETQIKQANEREAQDIRTRFPC